MIDTFMRLLEADGHHGALIVMVLMGIGVLVTQWWRWGQ